MNSWNRYEVTSGGGQALKVDLACVCVGGGEEQSRLEWSGVS